MKVKAIKTKKIIKGDDLFEILSSSLPKKLEENTVIAISSKIVAICEGRVVEKSSETQRDELAMKESELYLPRSANQYGYMITINRGILLGSAGIDQSNGNGSLVMWPKDPQKSANKIREFLVKKYKVSNIGVIIVDSKSTPLRWGTTGIALSHSGFKALKSYIGTPDIFGRIMQHETASIVDGIAAAANLEMGEGNEQKPIAVITEVNNIKFQKRNPTKKELDFLRLNIKTDFYAPILTSAPWLPGRSRTK
jgi:dihydrofolate synthase / folylpolyglutamate synthase